MDATEDIDCNKVKGYGKGYVIDHCVAFFRRKQEEKAYRIYVTDALKAIVSNTAGMVGGKAVTMTMRYEDLIDDKQPEKEEKRTGAEIINDMKAKMRKLKGG